MSTLLIAGDCCLMGRPAALNANELISFFRNMQPIIKSVDASLVNLETAVFNEPKSAIAKSGPVIGADERVLELVHEIGFSGVTLANNHFADYGAEGVKESLRLIEQHKLWHVGAGMNADEAAELKCLQVGEKKVAIINACEHEFTIATNDKPGCNALNPICQYKAIRDAKQKANHVIVIVHGGVEHFNLPTLRMQETYRFFIEAGADAVINHHQHCYSGYEIYQGKPIVYGLGNFFFDWQGQEPSWNKGYMIRLTFGKEIDFELLPYTQNADNLGVKLMRDAEKEQFLANIKELNKIIANPVQLQSHFEIWTERRRDGYMRIVRPMEGGGYSRLKFLIPRRYRRFFMPEYMTTERRLMLKSLFQCEAHRDVMNEILK